MDIFQQLAAAAEAFGRLASLPLRESMPSVWYPGYLPRMPDLLVFKFLPEMRRSGHEGLNATYKVIFVETVGDRRAVEDALDKPVTVQGRAIDFRPTIDRTNARRSSLPSGDSGLLLHVPPEEGWPYFVVSVLPWNKSGMGFARDRYGWDAFGTEDEALGHMTRLHMRKPIEARAKTRIVTPDISKYS